MAPRTGPTYGAMTVLRRLLREARSQWPYILAGFLLDFAAIPLTLLTPLALKIAVDNVVGSKPLPHALGVWLPRFVTGTPISLLLFAALLQVTVVLLNQLQALGAYVVGAQAGERLVLGFRTQLFRHVQRLSLSYHDGRGTADSVYRIEYDAPAIEWIILHALAPLLTEGLMLISTIYVIARINWPLALVAIAISPLLCLLARSYDRRMGGRYEAVKDLESRAMGVVQEVLTSMRVVKAFGREDREQERFVRHWRERLRQRVHLAFAEGGFGMIVHLTTATGTALVMFIGIRAVLDGSLTLGSLLLIMGYLVQLYSPLENLGTQVANMPSSFASARRALELLDEATEVIERPNARALKQAAGAVEFRRVSFGYERSRILADVSFAVPAGARVGICGPTGAGKTTLVSLLTRFYDPASGCILLDGIDLRDYRLRDLRNQFALVLQDPVLFSTTIAENIAYGRPEATEKQIIEAAQAANAHDFITRLPEGYRAQVGERGMMLSGGERQRVSIARAFLKDAPILILDEPTSSVDTETESAILEAMDRLMEHRTSFLISHRPTALDNCDILLVVDRGGVEVRPAAARPAARLPGRLAWAAGSGVALESRA